MRLDRRRSAASGTETTGRESTDGEARGREAVASLEAIADRYAARLVALFGVAVVLAAFLTVLHEILVITGDPTTLYYVVGGSVLAGTVLARVIRPRTAAVLGALALVGGTYYYVRSLPGGFGFVVLLAPMIDDGLALLSGLSVLRIVNADVWALTAAPGPVFLAWYLGLRRRYVAAGAVGGAALGLMVLTGDATTATTLIGVAGVTLAVAFGHCDRDGGRLRNVDFVVVVVAAMVVATMVVGVVPGAADSFISSEGVGQQTPTMESSLVHAGDSVPVAGTVELSPQVRYTVEADREAYWRVDTYDRYTGGGWVRSGELRTYERGFQDPPGRSRRLVQTYTARTSIATLPAANQPTTIEDVPVPVQQTAGGSFQPAGPLQPGESYTVESQVPQASPAELREAGSDYPAGVEERYTQLPDGTADRVERRTDRLTAEADNRYDTARILEQWFRNNYEYSLEVERPRGDVTEAFLFEMDAGYCTYFATAMVTMLRTQDIPARFAVGYTPGERTDDGERVVRGLNSHAWVEVYFPGHGWIEFDPTPPGPREDAEQAALDDALGGSDTDDDSDDSTGPNLSTATPTPTATSTETVGPTVTVNRTDGGATPDDSTAGGDDGGGEGGEGGLPSVPVPTREQFGFGLLVIAGLVAAVRRTGADSRLSRELWLRRVPTGDPDAVVAGAYHRVVHLEERAGRSKRPGETPRQFLADADERARRVGELYERARYGRGVDRSAADESLAHLGGLLDERTRLPIFRSKRDTGSR